MVQEVTAYIKLNLPFARVFQHYKLEWKGDHTHQLSCPFHGEDKNPSARYYHDSKRFHCFACTTDNSGDIVWFCKRMQNLPSWDASVAFIKTQFGVSLDPGDLRARMELKQSLDASLPRQEFTRRYKDRMNDLLYRLRQDSRVSKELLQSSERAIWDQWRCIEDCVEPNYIVYCEAVRSWFDDSFLLLKNALTFKKG